MFLIAFASVAERESDAYAHEPKRWQEKDKDSTTDRALPIFGGASGVRIAHGAALRERGHAPKAHGRRQYQ